jgi:hypothetical protein
MIRLEHETVSMARVMPDRGDAETIASGVISDLAEASPRLRRPQRAVEAAAQQLGLLLSVEPSQRGPLQTPSLPPTLALHLEQNTPPKHTPPKVTYTSPSRPQPSTLSCALPLEMGSPIMAVSPTSASMCAETPQSPPSSPANAEAKPSGEQLHIHATPGRSWEFDLRTRHATAVSTTAGGLQPPAVRPGLQPPAVRPGLQPPAVRPLFFGEDEMGRGPSGGRRSVRGKSVVASASRCGVNNVGGGKCLDSL